MIRVNHRKGQIIIAVYNDGHNGNDENDDYNDGYNDKYDKYGNRNVYYNKYDKYAVVNRNNGIGTLRIEYMIYQNYSIRFYTKHEIMCLIKENDHDVEYEIYHMNDILKTVSKTIYMDKDDHDHLYNKYTVNPLNSMSFDFSLNDNSGKVGIRVNNIEDSPSTSGSYFCSMDDNMCVHEIDLDNYRMFFTNTFELLIDDDWEEVLYYKKV